MRDFPKPEIPARKRSQSLVSSPDRVSSESTDEKWFLRPGARTNDGVRLFCFPCAGYGAAMYRPWINARPGVLDVYPVQPPGRANRLGEPAVASIPDLATRLAKAIAPLTDRPYAFFGHSFGATLAAFTCLELEREGCPVPVHLFLSARHPPNCPSPVSPMSHMSDDDFVSEINTRYGGIPEQILNEPDILAMLLPALRADIRSLELIEGQRVVDIPAPITTFGGLSDSIISADLIDYWQDWTSYGYRRMMFEGDHFFLDNQREALLDEIAETLKYALGDSPRQRLQP
nr:alpha/beta fold hydrolase [Heliomarina baculiformis]